MNIIGSEINIGETPGGIISPEDSHLSPELSSSFDDPHPSLTPPNEAERMFLPHLDTSNISAMALASQIHRSHRPLSINSNTTDNCDFYSAHSHENNHSYTPTDTPFDNDALAYSREPILEQEDMTEEQKHMDPAEKVYDTAKGVWAWGKGIFVFSPFMGLAEGVAGKVVSFAGSDLKEVDGFFNEHLHQLDSKVLNPAIEAVVRTILATVNKTENFVKPIVSTALKPFGLIKNQPKNKEVTHPEITHEKATMVS